VRVYDLKVNKHEPVGETRVNKKSKLTHVSFSPISPIICVGDDRGVVTVLKLSANLRRMSARSQKELDTVTHASIILRSLTLQTLHTKP
jgi:dynein intermediate chain 1